MHLSQIFLYTLELFQRHPFPYGPGALERLGGRKACQEEQNNQTRHGMAPDLAHLLADLEHWNAWVAEKRARRSKIIRPGTEMHQTWLRKTPDLAHLLADLRQLLGC